MDHLDFIVWILGYPLMWAVADLLSRLYVLKPPKEYSDDTQALTSFVQMIIWFGIGWALW